MAEPSSYTSRTLAEPIAAVAVCPEYPEYMVVGTYSLLKPDEEGPKPTQIRTGSVIVLPLDATFKPAFPGAQPPLLAETCLNAAVLDIRFRPSDGSLFGVATSDARMTFFKIVKNANVLARRVEMQLTCLGSVTVAEETETGEIPLITAFTWLSHRSASVETEHNASIYIATSEGNARFLEVDFHIADFQTGPTSTVLATPVWTSTPPLSHTQEAWTVAAIIDPPAPLDEPADRIIQLYTFTGGDDSALIASSIRYRLNTIPPPVPGRLKSEPVHLYTDRKSHTAGVTALLPLASNSLSTTILLLLTGSYDEHVRLFTHPTHKTLLSHNLGGGVWQLQLMHESHHLSPKNNNTTYRTLILASCMHAGARVLRLTYNNNNVDHPATATLDVLAKFTHGHESMVYACAFRRELDVETGASNGRYTIVSTSFYDKKVCVWGFEDEEFAKGN